MLSSGSVFTVTSACGKEGGAMYDPPSHDPAKRLHGAHCWLISAPPVIIGDRYMSIAEGCEKINNNWNVSGKQRPVPTNLDIEVLQA
jgi:hypothetical protein